MFIIIYYEKNTNFILTQASFNCWLQAVFLWLVESNWSNLKEKHAVSLKASKRKEKEYLNKNNVIWLTGYSWRWGLSKLITFRFCWSSGNRVPPLITLVDQQWQVNPAFNGYLCFCFLDDNGTKSNVMKFTPLLIDWFSRTRGNYGHWDLLRYGDEKPVLMMLLDLMLP